MAIQSLTDFVVLFFSNCRDGSENEAAQCQGFPKMQAKEHFLIIMGMSWNDIIPCLLHETEAVRSGVTGYVIHGTEFIWTTPEKVLRKKSGGKKKKKLEGVEDSVRRWAKKIQLIP